MQDNPNLPRIALRRRHWLSHAAALTAAATLAPFAAFANERYPARPIRLLVGFPPGGGADFVARQVAQHLGQTLNTSVIVENKPGANGVIAASTFFRSILRVIGSISANTGVAPTSRITLAVATQEIGVVMTSSPAPIPAMRRAISMVQVPELNVRTGRPPKYADNCASNA